MVRRVAGRWSGHQTPKLSQDFRRALPGDNAGALSAQPPETLADQDIIPAIGTFALRFHGAPDQRGLSLPPSVGIGIVLATQVVAFVEPMRCAAGSGRFSRAGHGFRTTLSADQRNAVTMWIRRCRLGSHYSATPAGYGLRGTRDRIQHSATRRHIALRKTRCAFSAGGDRAGAASS